MIAISTPPTDRPHDHVGNLPSYRASVAAWFATESEMENTGAARVAQGNAAAVAAEADADVARAAANGVLASVSSAITTAKYKGTWVGMGSLYVGLPSIVLHRNVLWVNNAVIGMARTAEPGVSPVWVPIAYADVHQRAAIAPTLDLNFVAQRYQVADTSTGLLADVALSSVLTYTGSGRDYKTATGATITQASNAPRVVFDPATGACLGLHLYAARTNHWLHSNDFTNAAWGKVRATITAAAYTSPNGQAMAKLVEDSTASADHYTGQNYAGFVAGVSYTISVDAKAAERSQLVVVLPSTVFDDAANRTATFNIATGTLVGVSSADVVAYAPKDMGNGIWRCAVAFTPTVSAATSPLLMLHNGTGTVYTGDGTSGLLIGRAQLSAGIGDSPHIPTTTAEVTAPADVASIVGAAFSQWVNPTEGTLVVELQRPNADASAAFSAALYLDGNNYIGLDYGTAITPGGAYWRNEGAGPTLAAPPGAASPGGLMRCALAYAPGVVCHSANGAPLVDSTTSTPAPAFNRLNLGCQTAGTLARQDIYIRRVTYWPKRLLGLKAISAL